eukprot:553303-Rhodomonas_salina.2
MNASNDKFYCVLVRMPGSSMLGRTAQQQQVLSLFGWLPVFGRVSQNVAKSNALCTATATVFEKKCRAIKFFVFDFAPQSCTSSSFTELYPGTRVPG